MSPSPNYSTTRWCPTPEQVMILEELYRSGVTNPSASQIQRITAHLSLYGKIQGKSVFYWFQNHKARDRQKLRKKIEKELHQQYRIMQHHLHPALLYDQHEQLHSTSTSGILFNQYFSNSYSPHSFHPQGTVTCEEAVKKQNGRADLPNGCWNGTYGHDFMFTTKAGPTRFPFCITKRPIETLELFPLRSHTDCATDKETTASS